ncbi:MAG: dimethylargininase [Deltaproteobacteria bacterium]|nr:dimethylargininase [Deltaproteobacteria bacterium]
MHALTRHVPASFAHALSATPPDPPIDVALARAQHAAYRAALAACGAAVTAIDADEACPDCVFVEDTAVVAGGIALVTRPGAPSRRGETPPVARALARHVDLAWMDAPATLDGGDCLRVGRTIYAGRSARTNAAGIARLAEVFADHTVVAVDLPPHVLHLKCVCSPLGDGRILLAEGTLAPELFAPHAIVWVPAAEAYAANAVALGRHVVVADGHPRTREALEAAGFTTHAVAHSEVRKADGSLTCQSILVTDVTGT